MALLLKGQPVAAALRARNESRLAALKEKGIMPGLAILHWSEDAASGLYADFIAKRATAAGLHVNRSDAADITQAAAVDMICRLNTDTDVHGILLLMPPAPQLDAESLINLIQPDKDIDGLTPMQAGRLATGRPAFVPATARACLAILDHYQISPAGKRAVVIGRSDVIGKPVARLLLARDATVTICHSRTRDLAQITRQAEILVAAAGNKEMITADMVAPGTTVIDVGIHRDGDRICGDVTPAVADIAGALTPVPGGVGMVTTAMLLAAVLTVCEEQV